MSQDDGGDRTKAGRKQIEEDPYNNALTQLAMAAEFLQLDPEYYNILQSTRREIIVHLPLKMDDGSVATFTGYRVQHNNARGPYKGGLRYHPNTGLSDIKALSMLMTWKTALIDVPYGGAKGGITVDPKRLTLNELERLTRKYVEAIKDNIGPDKDIPAPDVGTNPRVMSWMMNEYSRLAGHNVPAVVTGKPVEVGGSEGRVEATGRGVAIVTREAAKALLKKDIKDVTVAVQGFGNVGTNTVAELMRMGAKVVAISDVNGGARAKSGHFEQSPERIIEDARRLGTVNKLPYADPISNEELLESDVDVLIPAAIENQITEANAGKIRAKVVVEAANGPTTPMADSVLSKNGIPVVPDILVNSGGVLVSYFEWVQNLQMDHWPLEEVNRRLEAKMTKAFNDVLSFSKEKGLTLRLAALAMAVKRVVTAMELEGWH